jgi:hypothetical protein
MGREQKDGLEPGQMCAELLTAWHGADSGMSRIDLTMSQRVGARHNVDMIELAQVLALLWGQQHAISSVTWK